MINGSISFNLTLGALIAGVLSTGGFDIEANYVILIGVVLTVAYVVTSYSRVLASL